MRGRSPKMLDPKVVIKTLSKEFPDPKCALIHDSPFQLLVATILSAQCTDARVNQVTPALFQIAPNAAHMARLPLKTIEKLVHSTGFYRAKARNIHSMAKILVADYSGEVPRSMSELHALPGVGRKTANVVLGNAFGIPGVVVDTHVTRLSSRWGWTQGRDAVKIEKALEQLIPQKHWIAISHWLILHGRKTCDARRPRCSQCALEAKCPKVGLKAV